MASNTWFRKSTWTDADRVAFEVRLKRAKSHKKPQYLNAQAYQLQCVAEFFTSKHEQRTALLTSAIALFERAVELPDSRFILSGALNGKARCLQLLGRLRDAADAHRAAIQAMRDFPYRRNNCWIEFCYMIGENNMRDLFGEAAALMGEFRGEPMPFAYVIFKKGGERRADCFRGRQASGSAGGGRPGARCRFVAAFRAGVSSQAGFGERPFRRCPRSARVHQEQNERSTALTRAYC